MEYSGEQFDVIVVGAGVMGSSTAYQIAKRGHKTLLLEQFDFLHHRGSSHGESRTIRVTYPEDYYSDMVVESSKLWEQAESEIGFKVYFKAPQLDIGPLYDKSLAGVIGNCRKNKIRHRMLDRNLMQQEFSGTIELPENWVAVLTELGGVLKPSKAVSMFQTLAIKNGAELRDNMEVVEIKKDDQGGVLVSTEKGDKFFGKKCVITAGSWIGKLVQKVKADLILPVQPLETSVFYWKIKEGSEVDFTIAGGFPTFASYGEPYIYGTPALEFPGLIKVAVHGGRRCNDPDQRTWAPAEMVVERLKEWIEGRFGDRVDTAIGPVMTQSCLYSMTPDEDFVIDFLGGEFGEDVVIAGGFSGHGFKMAPVVGKLLADLVLMGNAEQHVGLMKHFRLERFVGNPKGNLKEFEYQVGLN